MASMGSLPDEVLRILFLDSGHRLIADEQMHRGSVQHLELYPRTIFRRAIEHGATALIIVHNHPSGDPTPSESDIVATRKLSNLGRTLDIEIVDHIVVTATRVHHIAAIAPQSHKRPKIYASVLSDSIGSKVGDASVKLALALENARRAHRRRLYRREVIGTSKLFADPAWEMLVDLFIRECENKKVATSALCLAATVPPSTALRRVNDLVAAGYIVKVEDPNDGRRHFVQMTPDTANRLITYFSSEQS